MDTINKFTLTNGAGRTSGPPARSADGFFPVPAATPFATPALLSASVLDGTDTLTAAFAGQSQVDMLYEITKLFREIDEDATITSFNASQMSDGNTALFFQLKHTKDPKKLFDFRTALTERCRDIPRDLPPVPASSPERFTVFAPDGPGVLYLSIEKLKDFGLNIIKLVGRTTVRKHNGKFVEFAELRFKVSVPAGKMGVFKQFLEVLPGFGDGWMVRLNPRREKFA